MTEEVKMSKVDNEPWGFRLTGGKDFGTLLTIIKVSQDSLAERAGIKVGDMLLGINDQPLMNMTHNEAHEAILQAGNYFVFTLVRGSLVSPPPLVKQSTADESIANEQKTATVVLDENILETELIQINNENQKEEKPISPSNGSPAPAISVTPAPSEVIPEIIKQDPDAKLKELTNEVIPEIIKQDPDAKLKELTNEELLEDMMLGHAEVISGKAIGVDFYKLAPKCEIIGKSEVLQVIQDEKETNEIKTFSKFLQQPNRPKVKPKQELKPIANPYKPKIVICRKGQQYSDLNTENENHVKEELAENIKREQETNDNEIQTGSEVNSENREMDINNQESTANENDTSPQIDIPEEHIENQSDEDASKNKYINEQLLKINARLATLMCMPQEMQQYLMEVKQQVAQVLQLKSLNVDPEILDEEGVPEQEEKNEENEIHETTEIENENQQLSQHNSMEEENINIEISISNEATAEEQLSLSMEYEINQECEGDGATSTVDLDNCEQDGVEEEGPQNPRRNIRWQKTPPPKNRPFFPLTPKPRPVVLPGDVLMLPNDEMFSEDFIAETLSGSSEVIQGRAIGVNFFKFKRNYDHLKLSNVYKMVHQNDKEETVFPSRTGKIPSNDDCITSAENTNN